MRRIAVHAVAMRIMSGRIRIRILGGVVRYGDSKEMVLTPCTEIARTPAESLTLAECQNTKRRVFPVGNVQARRLEILYFVLKGKYEKIR